MLGAVVSCSGFCLAQGSQGSQMSDSLLNHSWPSFSKRWKKRWSFKRGNARAGQSRAVCRGWAAAGQAGDPVQGKQVAKRLGVPGQGLVSGAPHPSL